MKTLIIDRFGRITGHDPVHPFFYPLKAANKLAFIGRSRHAEQNQFCPAAELQRALVNCDWLGDDWQLILLLPQAESFAATDTDNIFPAHQCQAEQLYRFRNTCLLPLREKKQEPVQSVVIFYDTIQRQQVTAEPFSRAEQRKFQIDRSGYIHEPGDFSPLFSLDDLDQLHQAWPKPLDFYECNIDHGIEELPTNLKDELNNKCDTVCAVITDMVRKKIAALAQYTGSTPSSSLFLQKTILNQLADTFIEEIKSRKENKVAAFQTYTPARQLSTLLKETFAVSGVTYGEDITIIRHPMSAKRKDHTRQILEIAYLIIAIAESGRDLSLKEAMSLHSKISINQQELTAVLRKSILRWQTIADNLKTGKHDRKTTRISWMKHCSGHSSKNDNSNRGNTGDQTDAIANDTCNITMPKKIFFPQQWRTSIARVNKDFLAFQQESKKQLLVFHQKMIVPDSSGTVEINEPLPENIAALQQQLLTEANQWREEIISSPYQQFEKTVDWPSREKALSRKARFFFQERPTGKTIAFLLFTACCALITPSCLLVYQRSGLSGFKQPTGYLLPVIAVGICLIPLLLLRLSDKKRLRSLFQSLTNTILDTKQVLQETLKKNKKFLERLCQLIINKKNQSFVKQEKKQVQDRLQHIHFFSQQLQLHIEWAKQLISAADNSLNPDQDQHSDKQAAYLENAKLIEQGIDFSVPPDRQSCFSPVAGGSSTEHAYTMSNMDAQDTFTSTCMPGLTKIEILSEIDMPTEVRQ